MTAPRILGPRDPARAGLTIPPSLTRQWVGVAGDVVVVAGPTRAAVLDELVRLEQRRAGHPADASTD